MQDYNDNPMWTFGYTDANGNHTSKSFETISWVAALQEFVYFLKGTGFELDNNSIQINNRHDLDDSDWFGNYCEDVDTIVTDWSHPDDADLSMHFCPPFEGNPKDCAFKHEEKYEIRDLIEAVECLTQEVEEANHYKKLELKGEAL